MSRSRQGVLAAKFRCNNLVWFLLASLLIHSNWVQLSRADDNHPTVLPWNVPVVLHHIRAAGIDGSIIVNGTGEVDDEVLEGFVRMAHGEPSKILYLVLDSDQRNLPDSGKAKKTEPDQGDAKDEDADPESDLSHDRLAHDRLAARLAGLWEQFEGQEFQAIRMSASANEVSAAVKSALSDATGVWVDADDVEQLRTFMAKTSLKSELSRLLSRQGVLAGGPAFSSIVGASEEMVVDGKNTTTVGLKLIPDALLQLSKSPEDSDENLMDRLSRNPTCVGYRLDPGCSLIVSERNVFAIGESRVAIKFARTKSYPDKTIQLDERNRREDLTALRRFASQRLHERFPPKEKEKPFVGKGTLMIVGGGGTPDGLIDRFVELAGGAEASIVVLPISMPDPLPPQDRMELALKKAGAGEVTVIRHRTPADVDTKEILEVFRRATGVWFGGGRQWRFIDAYEGTQAARLMHEVLQRDGVIGGSSAGASIQGEYMARGNPLGSTDIMADGYERGLGFLSGVAIDQHFSQRRRFNDLQSLVHTYPKLLGIGIDEATAIVVNQGSAKVVGRNRVCFYDADKVAESELPTFESVANGGEYDLVSRKVVDAGESRAEREAREAKEAEAKADIAKPQNEAEEKTKSEPKEKGAAADAKPSLKGDEKGASKSATQANAPVATQLVKPEMKEEKAAVEPDDPTKQKQEVEIAELSDAVKAVIAAGQNDSRVMNHLDALTNRIGPRLTSSQNLQIACDWTRDYFEEIGLKNCRLEKWGEFPVGFNRGPWQGRMLVPTEQSLKFGTNAWTAGTKGRVIAPAIIAPKSIEELAGLKDQVANAWVFLPRSASGRRTKEKYEKERALFQAIKDVGPVGIIRATSDERILTGGSYQVDWEKLPQVPSINLDKAQWEMIFAKLEAKEEVKLEFDIRNHFKKGPIPLYNVIAEIPGTQWPDEYVVVGGHLDSWDAATGATDNAAGCATTLEAARILMASGVKPLRTIRFMLWTGEEQGLLGSRAYVEANPEEVQKVSTVFVHDGGTNYVSGIGCPEDLLEDFQRIFAGAQTLDVRTPFAIEEVESLRPRGGSDHVSFLRKGIPGFFWRQAGRAVYRETHHTQFDTYDTVVPEYQKHSALVIAIGAIGVANLDHLLSRKSVKAR